jgi:Uma2 family endonuclease
VRIVDTDRATYPDASVVCGERQAAGDDPDALTNPILLVEVLSDSTEADDRGEKFAHYRRIPSLREYVLVSQRAVRIEVFRRAEGGTWTLTEYGAGDTVSLPSVGATLMVDEVFRDPLGAS